jgi:hypothetical protein
MTTMTAIEQIACHEDDELRRIVGEITGILKEGVLRRLRSDGSTAAVQASRLAQLEAEERALRQSLRRQLRALVDTLQVYRQVTEEQQQLTESLLAETGNGDG